MFKELGYTDIIDIAFVTVLIYLVLMSFKRSRAAFILTGMIIIAAVYLVAQQFDLVLTSDIFQWFFAVILFAWVVIFQEEIRRFFEQIAVWSFHRHFKGHQKNCLPRESVALLVRTVADLARDKIGALIVLPGKTMIMGYLDGGVQLNGKLSEPLLKSISDPHSAGHDGAIIIEGDTIAQFGAHLPLSKNLKKLKHGGTRHAAALGLSELSDALCIVLSEERGTISIIRNGDIREVDTADALLGAVERFYRDVRPEPGKKRWLGFFHRNIREKGLALGLALLFWFVQVYGSQIVYRTFALPIDYAQPLEGGMVMQTDPKEVEVTFSGPRRSLYFAKRNELRVTLRNLNGKEGTREVRLSGGNISFPKSLELESIEPNRITVRVTKEGDETPSP